MKAWEKPKMIVLVRSKPEEGILTSCKTLGLETMPTTYNQSCLGQPAAVCEERGRASGIANPICGDCSVIVSS
jgi:hypothetical protein